MEITRLLNRFVPKEAIHTYSVDESFIQADGTERLWGGPMQLATAIRTAIKEEFGLPCAIGIGPNMLMAKLCLDLEAKKEGVATWTYEDIPKKLWILSPLSKMWGIGSRVERTLNLMGITTVGDLAHYPLALLEKSSALWETSCIIMPGVWTSRRSGRPLCRDRSAMAKARFS